MRSIFSIAFFLSFMMVSILSRMRLRGAEEGRGERGARVREGEGREEEKEERQHTCPVIPCGCHAATQRRAPAPAPLAVPARTSCPCRRHGACWRRGARRPPQHCTEHTTEVGAPNVRPKVAPVLLDDVPDLVEDQLHILRVGRPDGLLVVLPRHGVLSRRREDTADKKCRLRPVPRALHARLGGPGLGKRLRARRRRGEGGGTGPPRTSRA
jgi:hypothetical protein